MDFLTAEDKKARGRPTLFKYDAEKAKMMFEILGRGGDVAEVSLAFGFKSTKSFYNQLQKYPELKEDYEKAQLMCETFFDKMFMDVLTHPEDPKYKNFNTNLAKFVATNKFRHKYQSPSTMAGATVNIGSINTLNKIEKPALEYNDILRELEKFSQNEKVIKELQADDIITEHPED